MEGMRQFISLDENNKLLIRGNAVISEKGVIPSFDGEFVMYGADVQRLMVLLNEGNYLSRKEICLKDDDSLWGHYGWSTFAILNDEQVAEILKKQDATIKELLEREKLLIDNVKTLTTKIDMLEAERKALKNEIEEHKFTIKTLDAVYSANDLEVLKDVTSECFDDFKGALKRFFGRFKKKK